MGSIADTFGSIIDFVLGLAAKAFDFIGSSDLFTAITGFVGEVSSTLSSAVNGGSNELSGTPAN